MKRCADCDNPVSEGSFRDALSEREFRISGLCQDCQDDVFVGEDEDVEGGEGDEAPPF